MMFTTSSQEWDVTIYADVEIFDMMQLEAGIRARMPELSNDSRTRKLRSEMHKGAPVGNSTLLDADSFPFSVFSPH